MSGDEQGHAGEAHTRHVLPFPNDGAPHFDSSRCPCIPAIHRRSDGVFEVIHQWMGKS